MFASNVARGVLDSVAFSPKKLVNNLTVSASRADGNIVRVYQSNADAFFTLHLFHILGEVAVLRCRTSSHDRHVGSI